MSIPEGFDLNNREKIERYIAIAKDIAREQGLRLQQKVVHDADPEHTYVLRSTEGDQAVISRSDEPSAIKTVPLAELFDPEVVLAVAEEAKKIGVANRIYEVFRQYEAAPPEGEDDETKEIKRELIKELTEIMKEYKD